jgi:hypothetical protein
MTILRSSRRACAAVAVAAGIAGALVTPAGASPPLQAAGGQQDTSLVVTDARQAGGNLIVEGTLQTVWSGTFTGTSTEEFRAVFHESGRVTYHANFVFVGNVAGCGPRTIEFVGQGQGLAPFIEGHYGTIDQSREPVGVHAELDFVYFIPTGTATYSGTYHC